MQREQDIPGNTESWEFSKISLKQFLKNLVGVHRMDKKEEWDARRLVNGAIAIIQA